MSFLDKAKEFADKHDKQVDQALEKLGDVVDERTGRTYTGQIDRGVDEAQRRTGDGDTRP
jgi:MT0933-like antitoxin protein